MSNLAMNDETPEDFDPEMEELSFPPYTEATTDHVLWGKISAGLKGVYDPEIPVSIYELGLLYKIDISHENNDVYVEMTLTAPGCPVAEEMPQMVKDGIKDIEGIGDIEVDIVWDPPWDPSKMAETAKLQLNMF